MNKNVICVFSLFLFYTVSVNAQGKLLSVSEATRGQYSTFAPDDYDFLSWIGDSPMYSWIEDYRELHIGKVNGFKDSVILTLDELNKTIKFFNIETETRTTLVDYFPYDLEWISDTTFYYTAELSLVVMNPFSKKIQHVYSLPQNASNIRFSPVYNAVVYTLNDNIYVVKKDNNPIQLTKDGGHGIVYGSDYVHRQEFGINNGIFWSPNGNKVAWYRKNESMVTNYPLINTDSRIAEVNNTRYPMAGMTSEVVTLGVYDLKSNQTIYLNTGEPADQYLTSITWDPSEKYIYTALLNREQNHLRLNKYEAETGKFIQTLFEEKHEKYVEPENPLYFLKTKPDQFLWQSERDGFNHLYLYKTDGTLLKQLTKGDWVVTEIIGFDKKEENIFIIGTSDNGKGRQVRLVNLKSGKMTEVTTEKGTHSAQLNSDGTFLLDVFSSLTVPNKVSLIDVKNKKETFLLTATNPYEGYAMPKADYLTITSADGITPLNARIIRPHNFDPQKKYPVMVYVYGGPHAQLITDSWLGGARLWEYYMAQKGYIVFTIDNRGSANRGLNFENVIHRQLGHNEMADQMKGIEYLKSLSYVDSDRIGVYGWSFGGFMTISLMLNYPDVFKVGVAGGPVCDWKWYEVMYGERYMDTPQENPDGYSKTSVLEKAGNLKGKLLLIHGAQDDVVVMQHSLEFVKACIKSGKQVDYFIYPDHKHNVLGKDRVHLNEKISNYFDLYLK